MDLPTGEDIASARTSRGLTQSDLAQRADVSQPLIARIESGDVDTTLSTLHTIVSSLNDTQTRIGEEEIELTLPSALKNARTQAGYTQGELADAAEVSQALISRIENEDVNPRVSTLRNLFEEIDPTADTEIKTSSDSTAKDPLEQIESEFEDMMTTVSDSDQPSGSGSGDSTPDRCGTCGDDLTEFPDCTFCPHCGTEL